MWGLWEGWESCFGSGDGFVEIGGGIEVDVVDGFFGCWVDDVESFWCCGVDLFIVDVELECFFYGLF